MLLLFDIDGTLLDGATEAHRDALHEALRRVHGVDADRVGLSVSPAGRTDGDIARSILLDAGADLSALRTILLGGAAIPGGLLAAALRNR